MARVCRSGRRIPRQRRFLQCLGASPLHIDARSVAVRLSAGSAWSRWGLGVEEAGIRWPGGGTWRDRGRSIVQARGRIQSIALPGPVSSGRSRAVTHWTGPSRPEKMAALRPSPPACAACPRRPRAPARAARERCEAAQAEATACKPTAVQPHPDLGLSLCGRQGRGPRARIGRAGLPRPARPGPSPEPGPDAGPSIDSIPPSVRPVAAALPRCRPDARPQRGERH